MEKTSAETEHTAKFQKQILRPVSGLSVVIFARFGI
jgi:hypothetical protein